MTVKTPREYLELLMAEIHCDLDKLDGSYINAIVGAFAVQCSKFDQEIQMIKLKGHPLWCSVDDLGLIGRRLGIPLISETPVYLELRTTVDLNIDDLITSANIKEAEYIVDTVEIAAGGIHTYIIKSQTRGTQSNDIPFVWYSPDGFQFTSSLNQDEPYKGTIVRIVTPALDRETPDQYRDRIWQSYMCKPFNANPKFFQEYIKNTFPKIQCIRVKGTQYLNSGADAGLIVYLGDLNLAPLDKYTRNRAEKALYSILPVGTTMEVSDVTRYDRDDKLKFVVTYSSAQHYTPAPDLRSIVIDSMQTELRRLVLTASPTEQIVLRNSNLKTLIQNKVGQNITITKLEIYLNNANQGEYDVFMPITATPWITDATLIFTRNSAVIDMKPDPYI